MLKLYGSFFSLPGTARQAGRAQEAKVARIPPSRPAGAWPRRRMGATRGPRSTPASPRAAGLPDAFPFPAAASPLTSACFPRI